MNIFEQIEIINRINELIENKKTGTPHLFSKKLRISRSQLYRLIEFLKDYGAPIKYNRTSETFYYSKPFQMILDFKIDSLSNKEIKEINGGKIYSNFLCVQFLRRNNFNLAM